MEFTYCKLIDVLSNIHIDELRSQFKKLKNKNLEIVNLRKHIEEKLQKMLRRNTTRIKFAERFRNPFFEEDRIVLEL